MVRRAILQFLALFLLIFFFSNFKGDVHLLHNQQEMEHQFRGGEG